MALRALMMRRDLDRLTKEMEEARSKAEKLSEREKELEAAIAEAETDEERSAVEDEVSNFEKEKEASDKAIRELEEKIQNIEKNLKDTEAKQAPATEPVEEPEARKETTKHEERGVKPIMNKRNIFAGMDLQTRSEMFEREDVKGFLETVRSAMTEKRAIKGAGLLIPTVWLPLLRENIENYSKLAKYVNLQRVSGEAVQDVMGTIPEGVWTDCCGKLNELDLEFNEASVGCWKVAGYFAICNATLEDSNIDLASEVLTAIGQALGYALDKAIVFGLGTRMPQGIFTRLAETEEPADYPADARTWVDLHTSNIKTIANSKKGVELFQEILTNSAAAKGKYAKGQKVWVMNDTTYTFLKAQGLSINAAGAIVSGMEGTMPVVGGPVEILEFMPDYVIIGGYMDLYLLAERAGTRLASSEHVRFLDDQTVFKGNARYDGIPVIAEGFVAIGVNGTTPSASGITFAPDVANESE